MEHDISTSPETPAQVSARTHDRAPSFLANENIRLIIFGGKGGTGKTTSSSATAAYLAHMYTEKRFLVVSSDPAHSLADSLNCPIGSSLTPVRGLPNLWAIEMDSKMMLEKFKKKHRHYLENLSNMAYSSDQIDIRDFLSFKLPGMEEMMVVLEIVKLLRFGILRKWEYDTVIWDTAPTGHTLRLLKLPGKLLEWIGIFKMSSSRHKVVATGAASLGFRIPGRSPPKGNVNKFIDMLSHELEKLLAILKEPQQSEFVPVTIPEAMGIAETEKLLDTLNSQEIAVENIIVNRIGSKQDCRFCLNREKDHKIGLSEIDSRFSHYNIIRVPVFAHEVRGETTLLNYAAALLGETTEDRGDGQMPASVQEPAFPRGTMADLLQKKFQFLIFGGKGGVGKTTVSASTALALAFGNPDKRILVFSTDPAHSLTDSFHQPIGDKITGIQGVDNLYALEIDGTRLYEEFREDYQNTIQAAFAVWRERNVVSARQWKLDFDEKVMTKFVDTYPPGLEEMLALENIMESVDKREFEIYVLDTAPTGHLIPLLEFPELIREWLRVSYRAILKHHREYPVEELEVIAQRILSGQKTVVKLRSLLTDPKISEFVAVTISEAMGLLETEDLLASIKRLGIPNSHIVVNMIVPPTNCDFCSVKSAEQASYLMDLDQQVGSTDYAITRVPLFPYEIRGVEKLNNIAELLYGVKRKEAGSQSPRFNEAGPAIQASSNERGMQ
ncbi:ArsA family ATPase [Acidobacteria bacterium AH-259-A15]|nr:ArsA family ATPase [Acidobacteria bacterium AH-259-A15]